MSGTRKLAAILIADVVGFSRLMGKDEEGTAVLVRERCDASAQIARSFSGRLVKTMGDGLLLEFASIVAAVECSIKIQKMMHALNAERIDGKNILFRLGVNLGDVLVEGEDIFGEGVNVTARLEAIAEPGGICLSAAAYEQVRGRIDIEFADIGEQELKNIARPVRVYALSKEVIASANDARQTSGADGFSSEVGRHTPPNFSLVVLPFANIGGDIEQRLFADGVTDSLITDLARFTPSRGGRTDGFGSKYEQVDYKLVGREFNVRYIVEGVIQRVGDRLRVNARFVDSQTGNLLWADRFDKIIGDPLDLQDAIVARLASDVIGQLVQADARRAEQTASPHVGDLVVRGWDIVDKAASLDQLVEARRLFEQALTIEPDNEWALTGVANVDMNAALSFYPRDRNERLAAAETNVIKALSLAPANPVAHLVLGIVQIHTNRADLGIRECERALELDRSLLNAHGHIGFGKIQLGRAEETEAHVEDALRLSPNDRFAYLWRLFAGIAKLSLGEDEDAVTRLRRSLEDNRNNPITHFLLAAALANLDRLAEAQAAAKAGLAINPGFTVAGMVAGRSTDNPTAKAGGRRIAEGMRKAGVPERPTAEARPPPLSSRTGSA